MKVIPDFPNYFANKNGDIFCKKKNGKFRKLKKGRKYLQVTLCRNKKHIKRLVHQLILEAYVGKRPYQHYHTMHLNNIADDNRLYNLTWGSPKENARKDREKIYSWEKLLVQKAYSLGLSVDEVLKLTKIPTHLISKVKTTLL
jgi:hypothetical protein